MRLEFEAWAADLEQRALQSPNAGWAERVILSEIEGDGPGRPVRTWFSAAWLRAATVFGAWAMGCGSERVEGMLVSVSIARVLDGDTVVLEARSEASTPDGSRLGGARVRLIGVDAPELGSNPPHCYAEHAHRRLEAWVRDRSLDLEFDAQSGFSDRYDRVLGYLHRGRASINAALIQEGQARVLRRYPFRRRSDFVELEASARARRVGLWGFCP